MQAFCFEMVISVNRFIRTSNLPEQVRKIYNISRSY